jgi:hypothetical protein
VSGTTWKKKSRQGLLVERNVEDMFSVNPMGGFLRLVLEELKSVVEE